MNDSRPSSADSVGEVKEKAEGVIARTVSVSDDAELGSGEKQAVSDEARRLAGDERAIFTEEESEAVKRKVDRRIVPLLALVYFTQFLDKTSLNYASVLGLPIVGVQYNLVALAFYLGFLVWEIPTQYIALQFPVAKYLSFNIVTWGSILMLHSVAPTFGPFFALRFILGMLESCVSPLLIVIVSSWYKKSEQPTRIGFFYVMNGLTQIFGGLLAYGITFYTGEFAGWKIIFILLGGLGVVAGLIVLWLLPDSPGTAKFLTEREKLIALERVRDNQTGTVSRGFKREQAIEAMYDPKTWAIVLCTLLVSVPNGLTSFGAIIIKSFGYTSAQALLFQVPTGAIGALTTIAISYWAQKSGGRMLPIVGAILPTILGSIFLIAFGKNVVQFKPELLVGFFLISTYGSALSLIYTWSASNIAGSTKKATINGCIMVAFAVGNIFGSLIFAAADAPLYLPGKTAILILFTILLPTVFGLRWLNMRANKAKVAGRLELQLANGWSDAEVVKQADAAAFRDLTDKTNPFFVYCP